MSGLFNAFKEAINGTPEEICYKTVQPKTSRKPKAPYSIEQLLLVNEIIDAKCHYAYQDLVLAVHPRKNRVPGTDDAFKRVTDAYYALKDPTKRSQYDNKFKLTDIRQRSKTLENELMEEINMEKIVKRLRSQSHEQFKLIEELDMMKPKDQELKLMKKAIVTEIDARAGFADEIKEKIDEIKEKIESKLISR